MSSSRRERIRQAGRVRFILLYGICGWGLLFGLGMTIGLGLPAFLLVRLLTGHSEVVGVLGCLVLPMLIGVKGGFQWGSSMWQALFEQSPESSPAQPSA